LSRAADYPEVARTAIKEMHRQVGDLLVDENGLARQGLLVRHLVMPGQIDQARAIFSWLASEISRDTYLNIMGQYRPEHRVPGNSRYADIDHRPKANEMLAATAAAQDAGLWRLDERR